MPFLLLIFCVALPTAAQSSSPEELQVRYTELAKQLEEYSKETDRLAKAGYGGPVLRKDIAILTAKVQALQKELEGLGTELAGPGIELSGFEIKATKATYEGSPVVGPLENGEIIAFRAMVPHPETEKPTLSYLSWQLYNSTGKPVPRYHKQIQASESGGTREYKIRFRLKDLPNGTYTVGLTHQLAVKPEVQVQATSSFRIFQSVCITRIWVTDTLGDETDHQFIKIDKLPHLYVTFMLGDGIDKVRTKLTARNKRTGAEIYKLEREYERKKDRRLQRTGIRLARGAVKIGEQVVFEATIIPPEGKEQTARKVFSVEDYQIALKSPSRLNSGDMGNFSISLPEEFKPPFKVDVSGDGLTIARSSTASLSGTVSGIAKGRDVTRTIYAKVTDAAGRTGKTKASVTIMASELKTAQRPTYKPTYKPSYGSKYKPKPESPTPSFDGIEKSKPSSGTGATVDYAAEGEKRARQWWNKFVNDVVPDCLGNLRRKLLNSYGQLGFTQDAYRRWGTGPLYSTSHRAEIKKAEKTVLRDVMVPGVKKFPKNDCTRKFASSVSVHAQSAGLTYNSHSFLNDLTAVMEKNSGGVSQTTQLPKTTSHKTGSAKTKRPDEFVVLRSPRGAYANPNEVHHAACKKGGNNYMLYVKKGWQIVEQGFTTQGAAYKRASALSRKFQKR